MMDLRWVWTLAPFLAVACGSSPEHPPHAADRDGGGLGLGSADNPSMESSAPTESHECEACEPEGGGGGGASLGAAGGAAGGAASAAMNGSGGAAGASPGPLGGEALPLRLEGAPEHYRHVRLTHEQWLNSVQDNLRLSGNSEVVEGLTPDRLVSRYTNNEAPLEVGPLLVVDYAEAAATLAKQVASDPVALAAVYSGADAQGFVRDVGKRFFRRPLTDDEAAKLTELFDTGAASPLASDAFAGGVSLVLEVLLQAPRFLYRIESGEIGQRLNGYELATKLALALTNSTPSDELLEQAASGALDTDEGVRAAAVELLATARARATLRRFHGETFQLDALLDITKDASLSYAEATNAELAEASYSFFEHIFAGELGVRDVFLSDVAFVGVEMAALYGVEGPEGEGLRRVALGPERPGFFTQLPFLVFQSNDLTPDPIRRGAAMNYDVLCAAVPPEVPTEEVRQEPVGATNRETVTKATADGSCVGCHHLYLNPLGFAFENFDGMGRLRLEDSGLPLDTTGSYPFVEGQLSFDGAPQLMQLLAESQQVHTCYASHLAEFGLAHVLGPGEVTLVDNLATLSLAHEASLAELLLELVTSPNFVIRGGAR